MLPRRKRMRLDGYDYATAGAYFITLRAANSAHLFGEVAGNDMHLNDAGTAVVSIWNGLSAHYPAVEFDAFVVMPNHVHAFVILPDRQPGAAVPTISQVIASVKSFSSRKITHP